MQARLYDFHDLIEADGSDDDALTRDHLDQAVQHEAIDSLVNGRSTQAQQAGNIGFVEIVAGFEYTGDDAMFDGIVGHIAQ